MALEEYQSALKLQEALLPADHTYIDRTLHHLATAVTKSFRTVSVKRFSSNNIKHSLSIQISIQIFYWKNLPVVVFCDDGCCININVELGLIITVDDDDE